MKNRIFKYSYLAFFILLMGWGMSRNTQSRDIYIPDSKDNTEECSCLDYGDTEFGQLRMILTAGVAVVAPAESHRTGGSEQYRDCFKTSHFYLKNFVSPDVPGKGERFIHLLSNRHAQGFYIYTLEKLII